MAFIDYYKVLGISKSATAKEVKAAYRKLARKYHPDLNPNDKAAEQKFKEVNEANEVLSDPEKRKKYDEYGKDWKHADQFEQAKQQQGQYQQSQSRQGASQSFEGGDYSDFFEQMFGGGFTGGRGRNVRFKGQDFNADLELNLSELYETHKRTLTINGKKIRITIPAGIHNEQIIRIKGQGGEGANGGPKGDLLIRFILHNDTPFKRDKDNLYSSVDLDLYTALLGGEIEVKTFDGKVKLKVPPETQNGTKVKLKSKGFPKYKKPNEFGDLYLTYELKLPTKLSSEEKELFQKLSKIRNT
ncbi:MAG: J domain-containing protein [Vicingaceae bacterium]